VCVETLSAVARAYHFHASLCNTVSSFVNNILKHAYAKSIIIHLKQRKKNVILEIEDDGCGFDPEAVDQHGMGLRNMRDRASLIGGRFNILSVPGEGTRVIVTISKDKIS